MICGIRLSFYAVGYAKILRRLGADVKTPLDEETGELSYPIEVEWKHLKFVIRKSMKRPGYERVVIDGSLHKYWKGDNFGDFTYRELLRCIVFFSVQLRVPQSAHIIKLEYGVNIYVPFSSSKFLHNFLAHNNHVFNRHKTLKHTYHVVSGYREIKAYDKGHQERIEKRSYVGEKLRFELKSLKNVDLAFANITTLGCLNDLGKLQKLAKEISDTFKELVIDDEVDIQDLNEKERLNYSFCRNPKNWNNFKNRTKRCRERKKFRATIALHGQNNWQSIAANLIEEKLAYFLAN